MPRIALIAAATASALTLVVASPAGAVGNPDSASCEGAFASRAGTYAPGTVATLTHLLQADAGATGVPVGRLNVEFARTKGLCV
jgi:hypothetical protein